MEVMTATKALHASLTRLYDDAGRGAEDSAFSHCLILT